MLLVLVLFLLVSRDATAATALLVLRLIVSPLALELLMIDQVSIVAIVFFISVYHIIFVVLLLVVIHSLISLQLLVLNNHPSLVLDLLLELFKIAGVRLRAHVVVHYFSE